MGTLKLTPSNTFLPENKNRPLIIAGPCSVESEKQITETATALKDAPFDILRGGIWKPRTRPNSFEGVGGRGLAWLKKAGNAIGKPVGTEVASPLHVELALSHDIDVIWIGARTSANPFSVQAIADALQGVDIPVMVKNPVSPDIGLWLGALERINNAGIRQLAAIHRGFSLVNSKPYRNQPAWRIPIELKRLVPQIPLVCDPSHICGKRELLPHVAQEAIDLLFNGLMLEVHPAPNSALSDREQQLTPADFIDLISKLKLKSASSADNDYLNRLSALRREIDSIDSDLLNLLGHRMNIARRIGNIKQAKNVAVLQPERWNNIIKSRAEQGKSAGLSEEFTTKIYQLIHEEAIANQEDAE